MEYRIVLQDEPTLYHYGVKGMKWGIRKKSYNPNATVRKSKNTKIYEKLASSGANRAKQQDALFEKTKNSYNKFSAEQWRIESAANKSKAEESYRNDVFNKTASRKQKKEFYKAKNSWDKQKAAISSDLEFRVNMSYKTKEIAEKHNAAMRKKGLIGDDPSIFQNTMKDPKKREQYIEHMRQYQTEVGKAYTDAIVSKIGDAPVYDMVLKKK